MDVENNKLKEYTKQLKEYGIKMYEKVQKYREHQKLLKEEQEAQEFDESVVKFRPIGSSIDSFKGFNESEEVQDYYSDLKFRYGETIAPYEAQILNSKTLKEAMFKFTKIFSSLGSKQTTKVSEALDPEDRKAIIESQMGIKINPKRSLIDERLPEGWE
jgi:hypothetical protein